MLQGAFLTQIQMVSTFACNIEHQGFENVDMKFDSAYDSEDMRFPIHFHNDTQLKTAAALSTT
jgi:hypothetical protein